MSSFLTQSAAQNSPSIAMEKGTYRIRRGPLLRNPENFTFPSKPTLPAHARYRRPYAGRGERIPSYIGKPDITGKVARSTRHILDVHYLLLFRDRVLFVYYVEVGFRFSPNQRHRQVCH